MEVVSQAQQWSTEITCRDCKAVLKIQKGDLRVENHAVGYAGETWEPEIAVTCAVCETSLVVTGKIPEGMKGRLMEAARARRG